MASKLKFILVICLSAGLGLCWYPLSQLVSMRMESSQLLFFSFAAASVSTIVFMALQVAKWRKDTLELLILGLTGGTSIVLFHYALLLGNPIVAISLFCMSVIAALFLDRLAKGGTLAPSEFIIILSLLLVAIATMFVHSLFGIDWSLLLAILSGVGVHRFWVVNKQARYEIPFMTRLGAIFISSTWLVGMVLIFSPRSASFPQEGAALHSALYGAVVLVPIMASIVFLLTKYNVGVMLLWVTGVLTCNLIGVFAVSGTASFNSLLFPSLLLILAFGVQIIELKTQCLKENRQKEHLKRPDRYV